MEEIQVNSQSRNEMIDITDRLRAIVRQRGVREGAAFLQSLHTTAGLTINENADPDVPRDLLAKLDAVVNLGMVEDDRGITRRVSSITILDAANSGYVKLATWDSDSDSFTHSDTPGAMSALAGRARLSPAEVSADLSRRSETLTAWINRDSIAADAVLRMVAAHYEG